MLARRSRQFRAVRRIVAVLGAVVMALTAAAVPANSAVPGGREGDVYMRDQNSDFGFEPFNGSVWNSPDIKVCNVANPACVPADPKVGGTSYIVVTLNNPGPGAPAGNVFGNLKLYYTALGGAANWPGDWNDINTIAGLTVPPGQTTVILPWPNVPGPGHFCLLARWVSNDDPMTFAEGANTVTNTKNNNNIAWKNLTTVAMDRFTAQTRPFTVRNPGNETLLTDLVFAQPDKPFAGRVIVDLGPTLAARWKQAGSPGVGVRQVGATQVEIVDPGQARIKNLPLTPREKFETRLSFTAGDQTGRFVVDAWQADRSNVDIGGARYEITVK
ncbi:hypothetical protein [Streptomyces sp. NPDC059063]